MDAWDIVTIAFECAIPVEILVGLIIAFVKYKKCPCGKDKGYRFAANFLAVILGMIIFIVLAMLFL